MFFFYTKSMFNLFHRKKTYVSISPSIVIFTTAFLFSLYFFYQIRDILVIFFLSFILMVALNPAVTKLQSKIKSRAISIAVVYILAAITGISLLAFLLPPLASELAQLVKTINLPYFQEELSSLKFTAQGLTQIIDSYGSSINTVLSLITSTFSGIFTFLTLLVISFYLLIDEPKFHLKIAWFTKKPSHFIIARRFLDDMEQQLGGWVRGQVILMTTIGVITYIALSLIGVPYALPLALLAGLLEILPNLGPTLASVPAIAIAWIYGGHIMALIVAGYYILVQQIENSFLVPRVMKKNADVNPLIALLSILTGFSLAGVTGGFLAIPIYITLRNIYSYCLKYKRKLKPRW